MKITKCLQVSVLVVVGFRFVDVAARQEAPPVGWDAWCHAGELRIPGSVQGEDVRGPAAVSVRVLYLVPSDDTANSAQLARITQTSQDTHRWYADHTDNARSIAWTHTVETVNGVNTAAYYNVDPWARVLTELANRGYPIWQTGQIHFIWLKGGGLWAGGAQGFGNYSGNAILGAENFIEDGCVPTHPSLWPCVPGGAMTHELGHALGLPHPDSAGSWYGVDLMSRSVMGYHWNFPERHARSWAMPSPWGLLIYERDVLRYNPVVLEWGSPYAPIPGDAQETPALPSPTVTLTAQRIGPNQTNLVWNLDGANSYSAYWSTSPTFANATALSGSPTTGGVLAHTDAGQPLLYFQLLEIPIHQ